MIHVPRLRGGKSRAEHPGLGAESEQSQHGHAGESHAALRQFRPILRRGRMMDVILVDQRQPHMDVGQVHLLRRLRRGKGPLVLLQVLMRQKGLQLGIGHGRVQWRPGNAGNPDGQRVNFPDGTIDLLQTGRAPQPGLDVGGEQLFEGNPLLNRTGFHRFEQRIRQIKGRFHQERDGIR